MPHATHAYHCEVKEMQARPTLSIRFRTPVQQLPERLAECYGEVMHCLAEQRAQAAGPPFVIYYNEDMQDLDIEAGVPVPFTLADCGRVAPGEIPAGRVARCLHIGPYAGLGAAYSALTHWLLEQGLEGTGICYEFYLNDPALTQPGALATEIAMPLK